MGIDFSKFAKDIQSKIKAALSDGKINAEELRAMNLEKINGFYIYWDKK